MESELIKFLGKYTFDTYLINRLIVSMFVLSNNIFVSGESSLYRYIIKHADSDYTIFKNFYELIKSKYSVIDFEDLLEIFEFVISPKDKIVNGAVYTPKHIRKFIIDESFKKFRSNNISKIKIADIACGCGGFLLDASIKIKYLTGKSLKKIFSENLYGLDIQDYSIERTRIILLLYGLKNGEIIKETDLNLFTGNALEFEWHNIATINDNKGFNIILGNPPYVCSRNIDNSSKLLLSKWKVAASGHPDLYIPFFQIGYETLAPKGIVSYISVNSFFKSLNGRALREYFNKNKIALKIIDFGGEQVFNSRLTYTCICFLEKRHSETIKYKKNSCNNLLNNTFSEIPYSCLDHLNGWNLNNSSIANKIEGIGTPLGKMYDVKSGIATLLNKVYIFHPIKEDYYYYYTAEMFPIEKAICMDIINPNRLVKENDIEKLKKKIIFPYRYENSKAVLLNELEFKSLYPKTYKYLLNYKILLSTRDKGSKEYKTWYAYGRNQSLEKVKYKLFFPHITPLSPNFILCNDQNLLFVNGMAAVSNNIKDLQLLKAIMESRLFWHYIVSTSKHYYSGYYSLSRNYIKTFGIVDFNQKEREYLITCVDKKAKDLFIEDKYNIKYPFSNINL